MPPKKPDPKDAKGKPAGAPGSNLVFDDDFADLPTLPPLNNFIFTTLAAFKYKRNFQRLQSALLKHYSFQPEDTVNNPKFKTVQREDILNFARGKNYITEEELT